MELKKNKKPKALDQFYTNPIIADKCVLELIDILKDYVLLDSIQYLEPSAGTGVFIDSLIKNGVDLNKIIGVDIDPKHKDIIKSDFLETSKKELKIKSKKNCITIGNPPFGKRSKLAIDFFNHAAKFSNTIAFIVPVQFLKWSVQSKLDKSFKLIHSMLLPTNSFIFKDKNYNVRCVFQIWTKLKVPYQNQRLLSPPPTSHPDFDMWQYNNTTETLKYFTEYDWDFCVHRQGFYDYTKRIKNESLCSRKCQWIFFKAHSEEALDILFNMDFEKLANKNTTVLGFGKADVVEEYIKIKGGSMCQN